MDEQNPRPAWREPMVWLVWAIPAMSVIAGIALVVVAVRSGGADVVPDEVRRTAQMQVTDLNPDLVARRLGLSAVVRRDGDTIEVLPVSGRFPTDASLRLSLRHPSRAANDLALTLAPSANGWTLKRSVPDTHDWVIQLGPNDGKWRIGGRWPAGQGSAYLGPTLGDG